MDDLAELGMEAVGGPITDHYDQVCSLSMFASRMLMCFRFCIPKRPPETTEIVAGEERTHTTGMIDGIRKRRAMDLREDPE
jgi:hypothetical protein